MMIKDEYKRLLQLIEDSATQGGLESILVQSVQFFESLRKIFPSAEREEKEELLQMINTLKAKLDLLAKEAAEKAGVSEEKLYEISADPSNYTPEQWRLMQETKSKLYDSARKLSSAVEEKKPSKQGAEAPKAKTKRSSPKTGRRTGRKGWVKS